MRSGERCWNWALRGRNYCKFHGGRRALIRTWDLGRYSKYLGVTLREQLTALLDEPAHDMLSLYEELALARSTAADSVKLWDAAQAKGIQVETRIKAAAVMRETLCFVRDMVMAASKVERDMGDTVSLATLDLFVAQVVRAVHDVCDEETAKKLEAHIRDRVRLPTATLHEVGTFLTPDADVRAMDEVTSAD